MGTDIDTIFKMLSWNSSEKEGSDITIVTYGAMVHESKKAIEKLQKDGISVELIDLRTVAPFDIDTIFKMLSWNSSEKEQLRGIDEAKKIEYLSVLFQPIEDKSVWENCAKVISSKSDNELKKYMNNMFEWIKDMNWPGAFDIYARIKRMNVDCIMENYIYAIKIALKYQDINWLDYLSGLIENPEVYKLLPEEYQKLMTKYYNDFWKE